MVARSVSHPHHCEGGSGLKVRVRPLHEGESGLKALAFGPRLAFLIQLD